MLLTSNFGSGHVSCIAPLGSVSHGGTTDQSGTRVIGGRVELDLQHAIAGRRKQVGLRYSASRRLQDACNCRLEVVDNLLSLCLILNIIRPVCP
jgi:hypothetical protein